MDSCCINPGAAQSWIDWAHAMPIAPFTLFQNALVGTTAGAFTNSTNYNNSTWGANTVALKSGQTPTCSALETTNAQKEADAAQWNFSHQTSNSSATLAPPLANTFFFRGGGDWQMSLPLDFGANTYTNLQLSFRDNAGTRGDAQGTVPVIEWTGSFSGATTLNFTLKAFGRFQLGLRCDTGTTVSMYEFEAIIVP